MTIAYLPAAARVAEPWRNGGGVTREIASEPPGPGGFRWRLSLAEIERDGPFSAFPGHRRILTVVRGDGAELTVDGTSHPVVPLRPITFPGESAVACRLRRGPVTALNVITSVPASVQMSDPTGSVELEAAIPLAIVVVQGLIRVRGQQLCAYDALLARDEPPLVVDVDPSQPTVLAVIQLA